MLRLRTAPTGPAAVAPEITFLVPYQCPRCHAALTAQTAQWSTWLRCPKCGRASLPPDDTALAPRERPKPDPLSGIVVTGPGDSARMTLGSLATAGRRAAAFGSVRQLVLVSGLFLSLLILLFSLLDRNSISASVFGFAALVFVGFLLLPTKREKS